jgi:hypothetical protein
MGNKIIVTNNIRKFVKANDEHMSNAVEKMADDTLKLAQVDVPLDQGVLQKSGEVEKKDDMQFTVWFGKTGDASDYAAAQEAGFTRGHPIKNYSTPGTGAHFLQRAGDRIAKIAIQYLKQAADRVKV